MPLPNGRMSASNSSFPFSSSPPRTQASSPSMVGVRMSRFGQASFTSFRVFNEDDGCKPTMNNFVPLVEPEPLPMEKLDQNEEEKTLLFPVDPLASPTKPIVHKFYKSKETIGTVPQLDTTGAFLFEEEEQETSSINSSPKVQVKRLVFNLSFVDSFSTLLLVLQQDPVGRIKLTLNQNLLLLRAFQAKRGLPRRRYVTLNRLVYHPSGVPRVVSGVWNQSSSL